MGAVEKLSGDCGSLSAHLPLRSKSCPYVETCRQTKRIVKAEDFEKWCIIFVHMRKLLMHRLQRQFTNGLLSIIHARARQSEPRKCQPCGPSVLEESGLGTQHGCKRLAFRKLHHQYFSSLQLKCRSCYTQMPRFQAPNVCESTKQ